jgi:hypothetical protein
MKPSRDIIVMEDRIEAKILFIRGKKVIMDRDLAVLYGVETKVLNQAVRRNIERFPEDFMFQLDEDEMKRWKAQLIATKGFGKPNITRSQIVTFNNKVSKYRAYVFTEQGIAMLSSVLKSGRAIQVNIQIMRTFTKLREMLATNTELREKIEKLEKKYDSRFKVIFNVIKRLLAEDVKPKASIGYKIND